ncbi:MAG: HAD-IA family hydrolase [Candidatus Sumerlaeota bacterium]|nr:HAD-IA family hydrolase [Candidatus Sumerlaeota bacterium]
MLQLLTPRGPRPVQAMLFDMDGTMADTRDFHLEAWKALAERIGRGLDADDILRRTFGQTNRHIIPLLVPDPMPLAEIDALSDEKERIYRELARGRLQPIPGLLDLVSRAHAAGVRLAVASSGNEANVRFILQEFRLERLFTGIAHAGRIRRGKPDPEIMLVAANDLRAAPSLCVVFEDAPAGLESARRAGMIAVGVETYADRDLSEWADLRVPDFREVLARLVG